MIVIEEAVESLVDQIPLIEGFKPNFHWGGENELNRYIELKKQPYPLVWGFSQPETHDNNGKFATTRVKLILATREKNVDRLNDVRLTEMFAKVLFPLADYLIEGFQKSNRISLANEDIGILKLPNFSEAEENKTIDYWDALELRASIRVSNNCEKTIKFKKL